MKIYIREFDKKITSKDSINLAKISIRDNFKIVNENLFIKRMESGKPYVDNKKDIFFNISHSNNVLVCVVDKFDIGIDIEKMLNRDFKSLSKVFCTDEEYGCLCSLSGVEQKKEFYKLWTVKESFSKLLGKGLKIKFSNIQVKDNFIVFNGKRYNFKNYIFKNEYIISICYK